MMTLVFTPNQDKIYQQLVTLIQTFTVIIIHGDRETGKHLIVEKFLQQQNQDSIIRIDLCLLSLQEGEPLQPSNFYRYLTSKFQGQPNWIYIRHWDKIKEIMEDYGTRHRYFPRYALSRFIEDLNQTRSKLIITTNDVEVRLDNMYHWSIKLEITSEDIIKLLELTLPRDIIDRVLPFVKKARPGQINQILTYIRAFPSEEREVRFQQAAVKVCGSDLDAEETVAITAPNLNLIGMEQILEAIEVAIIKPIEFNFDAVPLKKGIVLAGPPGTGKTSIGRWLAYRLQGKLYLVDGSVGVSGERLISAVTEVIAKAYRNAPAVVFIDDVDLLFEHADTLRSFLTLLDGLENKDRGNICVIVTCMDITRIPSSLIRGGRLELCLETQLPTYESCKKILQLGFDRMLLLLTRLEKEAKIKVMVTNLRSQVSTKFISSLASQMDKWNCADIHRCLDDVLRRLLFWQEDITPPFQKFVKEVITSIRRQYYLVHRPEERIDISSIYS